jgi:hypothetical protein
MLRHNLATKCLKSGQLGHGPCTQHRMERYFWNCGVNPLDEQTLIFYEELQLELEDDLWTVRSLLDEA